MPVSIEYVGTDAEQIKLDPILKAFLEMTPQEAGDWMNGYVTDLPKAKNALVMMAKILKIAANEIVTLRSDN